jgi:hypothetical protein
MAVSEAGHARSCALVEFPLVCWTPWENAQPDVFRRRISLKDRTTGVRRWTSEHFVAHFGGDGLVKCAYRRELWRLRYAAIAPGEKARHFALNLAKPAFHASAFIYNKLQRVRQRLKAKAA